MIKSVLEGIKFAVKRLENKLIKNEPKPKKKENNGALSKNLCRMHIRTNYT